MKIAVLGTGHVGQTLAGRFDERGDEVAIGTRDVAEALARTGDDQYGTPGIGAWSKDHPGVQVLTFADAAAHGELVMNATGGAVSLDALRAAGAANLDGKVLVDVSNPMDPNSGFPPTLTVANTDSVGEQIQRAFPDAKVVKSLCTVTAGLMVHPEQVASGDHDMFLCGDDAGAKQQVTDLLQGLGWRNVIDLGDIGAARALEMHLPIWLRLMGALQTPMFNVKVQR